jgi:hypothetical protein
MKFKTASAFAAVTLLATAPGLVQAGEPATPSTSSAAAPDLIPPPPAGKGQVVFFRKSSLMGLPYWTNVRENDVAYGKLTNGSYFVKTLDPGVHEFTTSVLGKDSMKVQVDAGETYYVQGKITMALVGYTIIMAPADAAGFEKVFKGLGLAKPEPGNGEAAAK